MTKKQRKYEIAKRRVELIAQVIKPTTPLAVIEQMLGVYYQWKAGEKKAGK